MIYRLLFLGLILLTFNKNSAGQFYKQSQADSLISVLPEQTGKKRIHTLLHLADCYYSIQLDTSIFYANRAKEEAKENAYDWGIYKANYFVAKAQLDKIKISEVKKQVEACIDWFQLHSFKEDELYSEVLLNQCLLYTESFEVSKKHADSLLYQAKKLGNIRLIAHAYYQVFASLNSQIYITDKLAPVDSAIIYFKQVNDSVQLLNCQLYQLRLNKGSRKEIKQFVTNSLLACARWRNNRHLITLNKIYIQYQFAKQKEDPYSIESIYSKNSQLVKNYGSELHLSSYYYITGYIKFKNMNYVEAKDLLIKAKTIHTNLENIYFLISSAKFLGNTYNKLNNHKLAIENFILANKLAKKKKEIYSIYTSEQSLGNIYSHTKQYEKAMFFYQKGIKFIKKNLTGTQQLNGFGNSYERLGLLSQEMKQYAQSILYMDTAIYYHSKIKYRPMDEIYSRTYQIAVLLDMNDIKTAQKKYNYLLNQKVVDKAKFPINFQLQEGRLFFAQKKYNNAIQSLVYFLNNSQSIYNSSDRLFVHELISKAYERLSKHKKALEYYTEFKAINDSIQSANAIENIALIQSQYDLSEKEAELNRNKQEREIQQLKLTNQEAKIDQQNQTFFLLILIVLIVVILGIFLFNRYKLSQENAKLVLQTKQLELEQLQERTNKQLEMAELRSDFYTNVSHEFRTPLTLILGPLEDLLKQKDIEHKTAIEGVHQNANHLLSLVNETLDLSKVENGHLPLAPTTSGIGAFVTKVAHSFNALSETQNTSLEIIDNSMGIKVDFDEDKLKKVLVNLLGNAFKYTPELGKITLTLDQPKEDSIAIHIKDTGSGIDPDCLPHIFQRFYQANDNAKGSGVGLALSKQLVELHGGTLTAKSELNKGSIFSIRLPLQQQGTIVLEKMEDQPTVSSKIDLNGNEKEEQKTILIIEDHEGVRSYLQEIMQEHYQVLLAKDGNEGIALAEQHFPDLIISDVMMPHKDGLELTQHLKQHFPTSHIPIVLLTAKAALDNKIEGLEVGADDYISKPFHSEELLQRCKNLIAQRDQLRELFTSNYFVAPNKLTKTTVDREFIEKAVKLIEDQLDNTELSIDSYCKQLALNRTSVHHKLKALTGKNTSQFIKSIRLKKAAEILMNTDLNITQVMDQVGFGSRETFNKAFREQFGMTPTEFRKSEGCIPLS